MESSKLKVGDECFVVRNYKLDEYELQILASGTVIKVEQTDDLSYHGSPWYNDIYTVKGDDGEVYNNSDEANLKRVHESRLIYMITYDDLINRINNHIIYNTAKFAKMIDLLERNKDLVQTYHTKEDK